MLEEEETLVRHCVLVSNTERKYVCLQDNSTRRPLNRRLPVTLSYGVCSSELLSTYPSSCCKKIDSLYPVTDNMSIQAALKCPFRSILV